MKCHLLMILLIRLSIRLNIQGNVWNQQLIYIGIGLLFFSVWDWIYLYKVIMWDTVQERRWEFVGSGLSLNGGIGFELHGIGPMNYSHWATTSSLAYSKSDQAAWW